MADRHPRAAGVLMHITSLPGPFGIGDFGPSAYRFVDWMQSAGARLWQVLPLSPTGSDGSPYGSWSSLALNEWLISPELLVSDGWLERTDLTDLTGLTDLPVSAAAVDFAFVQDTKVRLIHTACERVVAEVDAATLQTESLAGAAEHAAFATLRTHFGTPWWQWPLGSEVGEAVEFVQSRPDLSATAELHLAAQWLCLQQWRRLRTYASERGIKLFGDIPIYVGHDSVDAWANPAGFQLDQDNQPTAVAGVPPDAFSESGQRWGNPLYDWDFHEATGYAWWIARLRREFALCDTVRIDHFRGLQAYWAIPSDDPDATGGTWRPGPSIGLFDAIRTELGEVDIVAEDLGLIDEPVRQLLQRANLPGMSVLQFAFGDPSSRYLPHAHVPGSICYTGTHDNDTTLGWWRSSDERVRDHARRYLGVDGHDICWDMIRACLSSVADRAIVPVQDILALGTEARLNVPGTEGNNWSWRLQPGVLGRRAARRFAHLVHLYGRGQGIA